MQQHDRTDPISGTDPPPSPPPHVQPPQSQPPQPTTTTTTTTTPHEEDEEDPYTQLQTSYRLLSESSTKNIHALQVENNALQQKLDAIQQQPTHPASTPAEEAAEPHVAAAHATATAAAAAFQQAMTVSEAQKQQLEQDNDVLRQRVIQLEGMVAVLEEEKAQGVYEDELKDNDLEERDGDEEGGANPELWEVRLLALIKYKEYYGNLDIPYPYPQDPELPKWLLRQRALWRSGKLSPERKLKLEQVGGNGTGTGLSFLEDLALPDSLGGGGSGGGDGSGGGLVVSIAQQQQHVAPNPTDISAAEAEALAAIGGGGGGGVAVSHHHHHHPVASRAPPLPMATNLSAQVATATSHNGLSSRSEEKWESHFQRLAQYKAENGNCLVPTSTELGRWLCRQRHNHRYKGIKEERKLRLMALDPTCLGERLSDLTGPGTENGGGEGSSKEGTDMPQLSTKTKYNQAYESKLHQKWDAYFQQLVDYKNKNGHANFPTMHGSLGRWISRQRTLYRSHKLKSDRYEKLRQLGFAFEDASALEFKGKLDDQWEGMFKALSEHKEQTGHCFDVPENLPLGKWLYRQRWLHKQGNLRADRAEKLTNLGFVNKKNPKKGESSRKRKRRSDLILVRRSQEGGDEEDENIVSYTVLDPSEVEMNKTAETILPVTNGEQENPMQATDVSEKEGPSNGGVNIKAGDEPGSIQTAPV